MCLSSAAESRSNVVVVLLLLATRMWIAAFVVLECLPRKVGGGRERESGVLLSSRLVYLSCALLSSRLLRWHYMFPSWRRGYRGLFLVTSMRHQPQSLPLPTGTSPADGGPLVHHRSITTIPWAGQQISKYTCQSLRSWHKQIVPVHVASCQYCTDPQAQPECMSQSAIFSVVKHARCFSFTPSATKFLMYCMPAGPSDS